MKKSRQHAVFSFLCCLLLLHSCRTVQESAASFSPEEAAADSKQCGPLLLSFAGDIMAHKQNVRGNFQEIYRDIESLLQECDFSFCNLETTVDSKKQFSGYPLFNVQEPYADAAINAGFNVFSLANNHANDFGEEGLCATRDYFRRKEKELADSGRKLYAAGIKAEKNAPIEFRLIEKDGWRILFAAITEVLNFKTNTDLFDYVRPAAQEREQFLRQIAREKERSGCDLLIVSLHCAEEEYVQGIAESQKKFYHSVAEAGADILWINHPHVSKEWEVISGADGVPRKIIFYAMGNTISGQRRNPDFANPENPREYTGDSFLIQVRLEKDEQGAQITWLHPVLLTTYITREHQFVIKKLDDDFLEELKNRGEMQWASYLSERKKSMERIRAASH